MLAVDYGTKWTGLALGRKGSCKELKVALPESGPWEEEHGSKVAGEDSPRLTFLLADVSLVLLSG